MVLRKSLILFLFMTIASTVVYSQNVSMRFSRISIEDGLSQSTINDIIQDSRGFLWFATEDGLNRYDGYEFNRYKNIEDDTTSISSNIIDQLLEDRNGDIWIATRGGGLNKFDREMETFTRYRHNPEDSTSLSNNYVTALFEDRSGVILVGTQAGLNIYQPEKDNFLRYKEDSENPYSLRGKSITSIYEDHNDIIWIGTQQQGLNRFDREADKFTHYTHNPADNTSLSDNWIEVIYEDRQNNLWIGTQAGGLNKFNRNTQSFKRYEHQNRNVNSVSHNWILTMFEDQYGELWVGTMNGLNILDRENDQFLNLSKKQDAPTLNNNSISALYEDRSGVFWVGTKDDALYKFVRSTEYFKIYDYQPGNSLSLSDENVWAILESDNGDLWIGTQGGGLNRLSKDRSSIKYYQHEPKDPNSLSDNFVNAIYQDSEGYIWVGTIDGLNRYNPSIDGFKRYKHDPNDSNSLASNLITTISEDRTGHLWIGTLNDGLSRYNKEDDTFTNYRHDPSDRESLSHNKIWTFYEDNNGSIWVGTHGYGLNKFDRKNDIFERFVHDPADSTSISDNFINFVYQDQSNRFWIGTLNGLNQFHPSSQTFTHYFEEDGLPNDVIYGIIEDNRGHLWVSTNQGIADFNPEEETFRTYDVGDGLPSNEFRFGAYDQGDDGTMYFGGIEGVVEFKPDSIRDNPYAPPVVLTKFEIFNNPVSIGGDSPLKHSITEADTLNLSYQEEVFSFEFSGLHYAAPRQNQYAYKLDGFDEEWQHIENRRFTSFTNLPEGSYRFRVKAANKDGVWNEEGTSIAINISPPPWRTWWAYLTYAFTGLGLIFGFIQYRIRKEKKKKLQLERQNIKLEKQVKKRTEELEIEKDKTDGLLFNILPQQVAEELKEYGTTTPRRFEEATILFTDFRGFTSVVMSQPADRIVNELDEIFREFDAIIEEYKLEKIKTIGDAYMAAGGIPSVESNHAHKTIKAALDMIKYLEERNANSSIKWQMRVGIHTGSVIAGVVGKRKFTYDLWGNTVNIASRMEASGEAGKVNVSAITHSLVKDDFESEYRGKIDVTGQGELDMYFIKSYKPKKELAN